MRVGNFGKSHWPYGKCSCRIRTFACCSDLFFGKSIPISAFRHPRVEVGVEVYLRGNREEIPEGELGVGVKLWWSTISFCKEAICFVAWKPGKAPAAVRI